MMRPPLTYGDPTPGERAGAVLQLVRLLALLAAAVAYLVLLVLLLTILGMLVWALI